MCLNIHGICIYCSFTHSFIQYSIHDFVHLVIIPVPIPISISSLFFISSSHPMPSHALEGIYRHATVFRYEEIKCNESCSLQMKRKNKKNTPEITPEKRSDNSQRYVNRLCKLCSITVP